MEFAFTHELILAAPPRKNELVLHIGPSRGSEFAIFDLKWIDRNAALRLFDGDPFSIDLDLAELPASSFVVGIFLDGRVEQRKIARHVAGEFGLDCRDHEPL